jgi:predicted transcriptional regulator
VRIQTVGPAGPYDRFVQDRPTTRLGQGELESRVLNVLWAADAPMTPRDVHTALAADRDLAYTTITTILVRLHHKELVSRNKVGRAFAYRPTVTEEQRTAARMAELLAATADPQLALSQFVSQLSTSQRAGLRGLLGGRRRR